MAARLAQLELASAAPERREAAKARRRVLRDVQGLVADAARPADERLAELQRKFERQVACPGLKESCVCLLHSTAAPVADSLVCSCFAGWQRLTELQSLGWHTTLDARSPWLHAAQTLELARLEKEVLPLQKQLSLAKKDRDSCAPTAP